MKSALVLGLSIALAACSQSPASTTAPSAPVAAKLAPAGQSWTDTVTQTAEGYRIGNPDAPVKLAEYGSRLCPTCGQFARDGLDPMQAKYIKTGKVSYEFREYLVHGAPDLPAALLGRCGGAAPFFPLLQQMFINQMPFEEKLGNQAATSALQAKLTAAPPGQIASAWADYLGLIDFVKQRGLPEAKARACLADTKEIDRVTKVMQDAATAKNVNSTPTFYINDALYTGSPTWSGVETALKAAGA